MAELLSLLLERFRHDVTDGGYSVLAHLVVKEHNIPKPSTSA